MKLSSEVSRGSNRGGARKGQVDRKIATVGGKMLAISRNYSPKRIKNP